MGFRFSEEQINVLNQYLSIIKLIPDLLKEFEAEDIDTDYLRKDYETFKKSLEAIINEYSK